jgi:murein DD-endopeptidase MepM/ murein hydrolase activator NlpD
MNGNPVPARHEPAASLSCLRRATGQWVRRVVLSAAACLPSALAVAQTHETVLLQMPVAPACVSSPFGPRVLPNRPIAGTFHDGIDLPAPLGTRVKAVAAGTLVRVQRHGVGGLEMLVQHPGFVAVYSHLGLIAPPILEGRRTIAAGEWLGTVGMTGVTFGPHLYFGMFVDDRPVDPAPFLHVAACTGMAERDPRVAPTRVVAIVTPGAGPLTMHPLAVHPLAVHRTSASFLAEHRP